jgi:plasmid stabilization system protein ParE
VDFQLTFAQSALVDLEDILTYSRSKFPWTAERFGAALLDHVEVLKKFPYMGTLVFRRKELGAWCILRS